MGTSKEWSSSPTDMSRIDRIELVGSLEAWPDDPYEATKKVAMSNCIAQYRDRWYALKGATTDPMDRFRMEDPFPGGTREELYDTEVSFVIKFQSPQLGNHDLVKGNFLIERASHKQLALVPLKNVARKIENTFGIPGSSALLIVSRGEGAQPASVYDVNYVEWASIVLLEM